MQLPAQLRFHFSFLGLFLLIPTLWAQHSGYTEYEFKAGIILKFAQYIRWPEEAFNSPEARIEVGILGPTDPFGNKIDKILLGRPVQRRYWKVKRDARIKELWGSHIVFIPKSEADRLEDVLAYYKRHKVLTIGDGIPNFCEQGGIINFTKNFRFEVNIDAARRAGITIDARLLRLASRIIRNSSG
ncbi:MAG: YfiR family protein [Bacteroidota bacterium]